MGAKGVAAGAVARVHCDYTHAGAPRRFEQLAQTASYTGTKLDPSEVEDAFKKRFAFINVWKNTMDFPVNNKPLAVCDPASVDPSSYLTYELRYPERTGETYAMDTKDKDNHDWYYYPQMTKDEALMFYVFDKKESSPGFVMHTGFDHPNTPADAQDRVSLECRSIAIFDDEPDIEVEKKAFFFDMKHSNNAARIRLWLKLKGLDDVVDSKYITYLDL
jgi:hypothetical protein